MVRRYYNSRSQPTTLNASINDRATTITITDPTPLYPTAGQFTISIDRGLESEELLTVTSYIGSTLTVLRGVDGSSAQLHAAGAIVEHVTSARDFTDLFDHTEQSTGVHGLAGTLVDTTTPQTLDNKTLLMPQIGGGQPHGTNYVQRRKSGADQVVGPNTWSTVGFETVNGTTVEDDGTLVTGNINFFASVTGVWLMTVQISFSGVPAANQVALRILRNVGGIVEGQVGMDANFSQTISTSAAMPMTAGQSVSVQFIHNSPGNANVTTDLSVGGAKNTRVTWAQIG